MLGIFAITSPALAETKKSSFWASLITLVQEALPGIGEGEKIAPPSPETIPQPQPREIKPQEMMPQEMEEPQYEDFVDPREIQNVLKQLKDMRREVNRFLKQAKKMPDALSRLNSLSEKVNNFESKISSSSSKEDLQEFYDEQLWEEFNGIRAAIELPKELKQWNQEIKRAEKMVAQKKFQGIGIDIAAVKSKLAEIKSTLSGIESLYNAGNLEEAMAEFDDLRQDFHPSEIVSVMQRLQDVTNRLRPKKISEEIKNTIRGMLSGVISSFNSGDYREAREEMDETWNEIMKKLNVAFPNKKR